MTLVAHLADIHLGLAQYGLIEREEDIYRLFGEAVEECLKEKVRAVIIAGDLFDKYRPPNKSLIVFKKNIQKLIDKGIPIIAVQGDHDASKRRDPGVLHVLSSYIEKFILLKIKEGFSPGVYEIFEDGVRVNFYGAEFIPRHKERSSIYSRLFERISRIQKDKGGIGVLVGHFPITDFFNPIYDIGLCIAQLPKNLHYYALGHLHSRIKYRTDWGGLVAYSGSIDIIRRDEINDWVKNGKGFYIVDLSKKEPEVHSVNLDVRPQFVLRGEFNEVMKNIATLKKRIVQNKLRKPILHVIITNVKVDRRTDIERKVLEEVKSFTLNCRVRTESIKEELDIEMLTLKSEFEILSRTLGGDKELASLVIELKNCIASSESPDECSDVIEKILEKKHYLKKTAFSVHTLEPRIEDRENKAVENLKPASKEGRNISRRVRITLKDFLKW